jgi:predicted CXXCH cytochrome family protein
LVCVWHSGGAGDNNFLDRVWGPHQDVLNRAYIKSFTVFSVLWLIAPGLAVATIVGSKHDLSLAGGTTEICVFCHTPHNANNDLDNDGTVDSSMPGGRPNAPLWNRRITREGTYTPYTSDTLDSSCDATPSPLSLACLSCHDAALGTGGGDPAGYGSGAVSATDQHLLVNEPNLNPGGNQPNCDGCHTWPEGDGFPGKWWQIGPNMSNDHPISMTYPTPAQDPDFFVPPNPQNGWGDVRLFNGRVECPSCHNPHDPTNVPFLRKTVSGSQLCYVCHNK